MTIAPRPELNGARVQVPGDPEVWLIFHGQRHFIDGASVYEALFANVDDIIELESIDFIQVGTTLHMGSRLIRDEDQGSIYLLAPLVASRIQKLHIESLQAFSDFSFDEAKVITIPSIIMDFIPDGEALVSAFQSPVVKVPERLG